jgi:nucleotide-binding universal stress UspA family protein
LKCQLARDPGNILLMRLLVAIAELGSAELLAAVDRLLPLRGREVMLVHVIDTSPRVELEAARGYLSPGALVPGRERVIGEAERRAARRVLEECRAVAVQLGATVAVGVGEGEPGRVLCALAGQHRCEVVAVASRVRGRSVAGSGSRSVGRTARFILDNSPCPVLLVRAHS